MIAAPCAPPRPGLCSSTAPGKRQLERSPLPVSEDFLRPKSARIPVVVASQSPMSGIGGMRVRKAARHSQVWFSSPPVPGAKPVQSLSLGD